MKQSARQAGEVATTLTLIGLGLALVGVVAASIVGRNAARPQTRAQADCPAGDVTDPRVCRQAGCEAVVKSSSVSALCCRVVNGQREYVATPVPDNELNCYVNTCTRQILAGQSFPLCSDPKGPDPQCCSKQYTSGTNMYCEYPCNPTRCTQNVETIYTCRAYPTATARPYPGGSPSPTPRRLRLPNPWLTPQISLVPSITPSLTPSPTPTLTPTPTSTPTPTPTNTPTPSPTLTPTATPTPTPMSCPWPNPDRPQDHPPECALDSLTRDRLPTVPSNATFPVEATAPCDINPTVNRQFNFSVDGAYQVTFPWCPPVKNDHLREYRWTVYMTLPDKGEMNCFESNSGFGESGGRDSRGVQQVLPDKCRRLGAKFRGSVRAIYSEETVRLADNKYFDCCRTGEVKTNAVDGPRPTPTPTSTPTPQPTTVPTSAPAPSSPPPALGPELCTTATVILRDPESCEEIGHLPAWARVRIHDGPRVYTQCENLLRDGRARYDATALSTSRRGFVPADFVISCQAPLPWCRPSRSRPCLPENLEEFGSNAERASIVCQAESGGNPLITSNDTGISCLQGKSAGFDVGLFQINILYHSPPGFAASYCRGAFDWVPGTHTCSLRSDPASVQIFNYCLTYFQNEQNNINKAVQLSSGGFNWGPWQGAAACNIR